MMLKSFKDFAITLKSLPDNYLEELLYLTDNYEYSDKEDLVGILEKELLDVSRLKNYFLLLDKVQKLAVSETVHNLNGKYSEDYFLGKYGKKPLFSREQKVFVQKESPTFINLFIYSRAFIPKELLYLLKKIVPKPPVWSMETFTEEEIENPLKRHYTREFIRDVWYTIQFEEVILTNKNKLSKKSNDLIYSIYDLDGIDRLLELFIETNLIRIKENKVRNEIPSCSYNYFLDTLLKAFYIGGANKSEEYFEYRNNIVTGLNVLVGDNWVPISSFYSYLEIENFSTYQKNKIINNKEIKLEILDEVFKKELYFLELVELIEVEDDLYFKITPKGNLYLKNEFIPLNRSLKLKPMSNFEILILSPLDKVEALYLESVTEVISSNMIKLSKKKLLKSITTGMMIDDIVLLLRNLSDDCVPDSMFVFFDDMKKKTIYLERDNVLSNIDGFLINILLHDKKINKFFEISEDKIKIKASNRKVLTILNSLDYPLVIK